MKPMQDLLSLKVATWNIHKGVRGLGVARRLEVAQIAQAIPDLGADILCLQEVRNIDKRHAAHFSQWPTLPQADFLCPAGYQVVYLSNAFDANGEHGNALITRLPIVAHRHQDMSDHRFEQRGLLHVELNWAGQALHVIVLHLGLMGGSRVRQIEMLKQFVQTHVPAEARLIVAGDFNDWAERLHLPVRDIGLATSPQRRVPTFPSRAPALYLDRIYARGLAVSHLETPRGARWWRMSDHLPLIGTLEAE